MFIKKSEQFICAHCGAKVDNRGYQNHCPRCLWSKHVDVEPGDRLSECGGLMPPVDLYYKSGKWLIVHECQLCRYRNTNKIIPEDDFEEVIRLEQEINEKKIKRA